MELTLADLVIGKEHYDPMSALDPWRWRVGEQCEVLLPTALGHLFLESNDGVISFLDTWSGDLHRVAEEYDGFRTIMSSAESDEFDFLLMPDVVAGLREAGILLEPGQCYVPYVSPALGGKFAAENFTVAALGLHLHTSAAECRAIGAGEAQGSVHSTLS